MDESPSPQDYVWLRELGYFNSIPASREKKEPKKKKKVRGGITYCLSPSGLLLQNTTDWVIYKQQNYISHNFGGWMSEIVVPAWLLSNEGLFPVHSNAF